MPVKRRASKHQAHRVTDQAIEAWRIGDFHALNREIGIMPHQVSPFDCDGPEPPSWAEPTHNAYVWWPLAWDLRCELLKHCQPGGVGRHGEPLGPGVESYSHAD